MRTSFLCRHRPWHIIRALLVLAAALLLSACSLVRLGYSQVPELAYWWVDGFFDLNDAQGSALRQDLQTLHDWHRRQELPELASALRSLQDEAAQDVTAAQLCRWVDALKPRIDAVLTQSEPGLATLVARLSPEQLTHLQRQLEKRQQKWRDEWLKGNSTERQARRLERLVDRVEDFYGPLSPTQRALLQRSIANSPFDLGLTEAEMLRRQQDFLQTLQRLGSTGPSPQQMRTELHLLLQRSQNSPNAAYRAHVSQLTQANCDTLATLHNSSSVAQRARLIARLKGFEDDARAMTLAVR
jgi:hypothetical protein